MAVMRVRLLLRRAARPKSGAGMVKVIRDIASRPLIKQLGPGLVTGAADDDPSGIATYSQAGAQFGFNMLWTVVFTYPLMVAIQMVSARIGCMTGRGLAANIRERFPRPILLAIVGSLLIANTINIAADIAAMGEALRLLVGGSARLYSVIFGLLCLGLQVFLRYERYVGYLKWLTVALLSYVAVVFTAHVPWLQVLHHVAMPQLHFDHDTIMMLVAVFGTTISPYLFFWQAAQETEDLRAMAVRSGNVVLPHARDAARQHMRRIRLDTYVGMGFSNTVAFFIILSTAATMFGTGAVIETSAQAAEALRPLGGPLTFLLFTLGIVGTGMLAVPVLAGSAAYAVTECFDWKTGLDMQLHEAKEFYGIIAFATVGGVVLNFTGIDPIRALLWSADINCVIAVPIMIVMMRLATDKRIMGSLAIRPQLRNMGWAATALMGVTVGALFVTM
jgi:NRAMP (natural resistance-associated macrophage protein)-like metal ion transporter